MTTSDAGWKRDHVLGLLAVTTAVGAYLRARGVESGKHLWNDSVVSVVVVDRLGPVEMLTVLPRYDPHPPLYYLVLDAWTSVFGSSVLAGRALSIVVGVASVPLLYLVAAELFDRNVGLVSASLLAVSPYHVRISQTVRMYALLLAAALVSYLMFQRLLDRWDKRQGFVYAVATFVAGGVHAFGALVLVAQSLTVIWLAGRGDRVRRKRWLLGVQSAVALSLAPWYIVLLKTSVSDERYPIDWLTAPDHVDVYESLLLYLGPELTELDVFWLAALLPATALLLLGVYGVGQRGMESEDGWSAEVVLAAWLIVPVLAAFVASYVVRPVLHPRYFAGTSVAALIAVSRGLYSVDTRDLRALILVAVVAVSFVGLSGYYGETAALREEFPWESSARYIDGNAASGDVVIVDHGDASRELTEIQIAPEESIRSSDFFDVHLRRDDVEVVGLDSAQPAEIHDAAGCHPGIWMVFHGITSSRERIESVLDEMDERYELVGQRMFNSQVLVVSYRQDAKGRPECG